MRSDEESHFVRVGEPTDMSDVNGSVGSSLLRGPLRKRESHLWMRSEHDFYVEPEWCSRCLFDLDEFRGGVWDPACGIGRIVASAIEKGIDAVGSDISDRCDNYICDFLDCDEMFNGFSNIVSNPPFGIAEKFVVHALKLARSKVAMLLPANWVQGQKRARWLASTPLYRIYFVCPRPSMPPGAVVQAGGKPGNGTTDYAWFVWLHGFVGAPTVHWLHRDGAPA